MKYDLAGTGSMVVDRIARTPRMIPGDEKVLLEPQPDGSVVSQRVGGVTLNHLGWARLLGLSVAIFGKQADDADGRFLRDGMRSLGIEAALDLSGSSSSSALVLLSASGGRAIYMARGATGELTAGEIESVHRSLIESASLVSTEISQVPLDAVVAVLEIARAAGARTFLDVDVPLADATSGLGTKAQLHAALEHADVIKGSLTTLADLAGTSEPERIVEQLADRYGAGAVVLTLGAEGAVVRAAGQTLRSPASRAKLVDSTGAGDAFTGGWLAAMHRGLEPADTARLANACGAACCEQLGAFPDDPERCIERIRSHHRALGGADLEIRAPADAGGAAVDQLLDVTLEELERVRRTLDRKALTGIAAAIREAQREGGRVHVTGVGKPEHVAHYTASLLASTGTPATFLHGTEAAHGSAGQVTPDDIVVAISNSGETQELLATVAAVKGLGAKVVAVTASADSTLGRSADHVLPVRVEREGGPLQLAPRASILAETLALIALSVELQATSGFTKADYNQRHPGGTLGKKST